MIGYVVKSTLYKVRKENSGERKERRGKGTEETRNMNDRGIYGMPRFSPRTSKLRPTIARRTWINMTTLVEGFKKEK